VPFRQERVVQFKQREIVLVRQEPINEAGQANHAAERFLQLGQNNRAANLEQQAVNPVQEEEEDVLQVQFQEEEQRN
jgi:hypothetical protein